MHMRRSAVPEMVGAHQNLNDSPNLTMTPLLGMVFRPWASICYRQPIPTKFEVSISTHYEDMKGDTKYRNGVVCGRWGHSKSLKV